METEPLVNLKPGSKSTARSSTSTISSKSNRNSKNSDSRSGSGKKMSYNTEDGSSILRNPHSNIEDEDSGHPPSSMTVDSDKAALAASAVTVTIDPNLTGYNGKDKDAGLALLEKFHEDALQQVGYGRMQIILYIVCGLTMAVDLVEIMALIMSSKSAQFEFCVDDTQKSWIVGAGLIGMGVGSLFWGILGDRIGRKRALTYALGVGAIFNLASVVMPTEGTFLTSRLFGGIGLGGCVPLVVTYFSEFIQEKRRRLAIGLLYLWWPIGAAYVIVLSLLILPSNGLDLNDELKHHFSSWRKLLVASTAPNLFCLVFFIFMPEGPLTLMETGRDAESLDVYKSIHKKNRGSGSTFCFSEIELPSVNLGPTLSPKNVIGDLKEAVELFWTAFLKLWTEHRRRLTIILCFIWLLAGVGQGALTSWVVSQQANIRDWTFDSSAKFMDNKAYFHDNIVKDLSNIRYRNSTFENMALVNLTMNHVKFESCSFHRVNFTNVRASYVIFKDSELSDCFFLDSDLGRSNFQNCALEGIVYEGLDPECHLIPDFNMELKNDVMDSGLPTLGIFIGALLATVLIGFLPQSRARIVGCFLFLAAAVSTGLTIWTVDPNWSLVGHMIINIYIAGTWSTLITAIDMYPGCSRGVQLGLMTAVGRIGSFFGVGLFGTTLHGIIVPIFSSIFLVISAGIAFRSQF